MQKVYFGTTRLDFYVLSWLFICLLKYTIILSLQKTVFSSNGAEQGRPKVKVVLKSPQITESSAPLVQLWQTIPSCPYGPPKYDQTPIFENFQNFVLSCDVIFKNDQSDRNRINLCFLTFLKTFCYYGIRHNIATFKYQIILP